MKISIQKLPRLIHEGDWHDAPLKWEALGPGTERQLFSTKAEATLYKRIRSSSVDRKEACNRYIAS